MRVRELSYIQSLENFKLVTGDKGLDNVIENIVIFEYESIAVAPDNYYTGDFIVTTLIFAKDHPELIVPTLMKLMSQGISGMAIKTVYYEELPSEIMDYAKEAGLPVFFFHNTYIEDVIVGMNDYRKSQENYTLYTEEFQELIAGNLPEYKVSQKAELMNPGYKELLSIVYLKPIHQYDRKVILDILNSLSKRKNLKYIEADFRFYQYREGIFILHNYQKSEKEESFQKYQTLLNRLEIPQSAIITGSSDAHNPLTEFDSCIKESIYACNHAMIQKIKWQKYENLGIYKLLFPLLQDKTARKFYESILALIVDYDRLNHANLLLTLQEYVKCDCDIKKTAENLFGHPNTVRYRIQKAYDLVEDSGTQEKTYIIYMVVLIWELEEAMNRDRN